MPSSHHSLQNEAWKSEDSVARLYLGPRLTSWLCWAVSPWAPGRARLGPAKATAEKALGSAWDLDQRTWRWLKPSSAT